MIREKLGISLVNIFCPPLAVMLVAGPGMDCIINTLFFIAGVLPGHIHGFYVTWTYFNRKRKVRKGRYPGGRKRGIYSERVWYGGASRGRVEELWVMEQERERLKRERLKREGVKRTSDMGMGRMGSNYSAAGERVDIEAQRQIGGGRVERTRSTYGAADGGDLEMQGESSRLERTRSATADLEAQRYSRGGGAERTRSTYNADGRRGLDTQSPWGGRNQSRRISRMDSGIRKEMFEVQGWRL